METPEEERHDYDPAPESETPQGDSTEGGGSEGDVPEGLDSQQGGAGGEDRDADREALEKLDEADGE